MRHYIFAFCAVSLLCILMTGCSDGDLSRETTEPTVTESSAHTDTPGYFVPSVGDASDNEEAAKNCILDYPAEYLDDVIIIESEQDGVYSSLFTVRFDDSDYELFAVSFGEGGEGELFGYISSGDADVPVYIRCYSLPEGHTLNEEQKMKYYQLMDAINTVTASISETKGFLLA